MLIQPVTTRSRLLTVRSAPRAALTVLSRAVVFRHRSSQRRRGSTSEGVGESFRDGALRTELRIGKRGTESEKDAPRARRRSLK